MQPENSEPFTLIRGTVTKAPMGKRKEAGVIRAGNGASVIPMQDQCWPHVGHAMAPLFLR